MSKFLTLLVFFSLISANIFAESNFAEIYLNKLKKEKENEVTPLKDLEKEKTEVATSPELKTELKPEPKVEATKQQEKTSVQFGLNFKSAFNFFALKSIDQSTNQEANLSSDLCKTYQLQFQFYTTNFRYLLSYKIDQVSISNTSSSNSIRISNLNHNSHSFSASAGFHNESHFLDIGFGINESIHARSTSSTNVIMDYFKVPLISLKYEWKNQLNNGLNLKPYLEINNFFSTQTNVYKLKNSNSANVGLNLEFSLVKTKISLENNLEFKLQRSDYSKDEIKTLSSGISIGYDF